MNVCMYVLESHKAELRTCLLWKLILVCGAPWTAPDCSVALRVRRLLLKMRNRNTVEVWQVDKIFAYQTCDRNGLNFRRRGKINCA